MEKHPFLRELDAIHEVCLRYEDEETRAIAASLVPTETLKARVAAKDPSPDVAKDLLLVELIQWFKDEFFSWHDQPLCETCKVQTHHQGLTPPSREEMRYLAERVESYFCAKCRKSYRFPRYNCPRKLMETRVGRCGEWANVFTLFCLALDFDARYIYDVTDHVWTEVWSEAQGRWLHCDACEAEIDKPLMYEVGWGKKLKYILAFSSCETADVTWRYVTDFEKTMKLRTAIDETDLIHYQEVRTRRYQEKLSKEEKDKIARRRVMELTEFLTPPKYNAQDKSYGGRVSGDLDWRLARNETSEKTVISNKNPDVKELQLTYVSSKDEYTLRENGREISRTTGWTRMLETCINVSRKVEKDWKMAYLARSPNTEYGLFRYQFKVTKPCRSIEIYLKTDVFENGKAVVNVIADGTTICVRNNELTGSLDNSKDIVVACEMTGGKGDCAWQHAQAFRQALDDDATVLKIILRF
ncbi:peptide-N(4)-(N-acetyl-beta-glucosaminyl)asparagine amidase [Galendromus occidentalis]|uniref:Peptide-N(4)-(N-acetyl-beta-glucosaminyl)asparagine amidase n=1 Tax=Galendromus occidentalis TaxID=34638 RepID=A0AAJ6VU99_9ACAR|nr:peptide-N(4)-(N-acetyl-beta-glucosaminyl)asparagine amidase [Galendromus occidentalis]